MLKKYQMCLDLFTDKWRDRILVTKRRAQKEMPCDDLLFSLGADKHITCAFASHFDSMKSPFLLFMKRFLVHSTRNKRFK